jgi:hypothetical protein
MEDFMKIMAVLIKVKLNRRKLESKDSRMT